MLVYVIEFVEHGVEKAMIPNEVHFLFEECHSKSSASHY